MPTWAVAILAAVPSGFLGAWFGAWQQTRHDRIERLSDRRIDAADALVQAWPVALFAIDHALGVRDAGRLRVAIAKAHGVMNEAVRVSVRVDLVFGSMPASIPRSTLPTIRESMIGITGLRYARPAPISCCT